MKDNSIQFVIVTGTAKYAEYKELLLVLSVLSKYMRDRLTNPRLLDTYQKPPFEFKLWFNQYYSPDDFDGNLFMWPLLRYPLKLCSGIVVNFEWYKVHKKFLMQF